jgi:hypothetical protein
VFYLTKKEATAHFREMLRRHEPDVAITGDDASALMWLLQQHPAAIEKIGSGVCRFTTWVTPYGNKGFRIVRADGSSTDFSYLKCLNGSGPLPTLVKQAMRTAIRDEMLAYKEKYFLSREDEFGCAPCELTGKRLRWEDAHVDHAHPYYFEVLVTTFLAGRGLKPEDVPITPSRDNEVGREVTDPELVEDFRRYHRELADLRVICRTENLKIASDAKRDRKRHGAGSSD